LNLFAEVAEYLCVFLF